MEVFPLPNGPGSVYYASRPNGCRPITDKFVQTVKAKTLLQRFFAAALVAAVLALAACDMPAEPEVSETAPAATVAVAPTADLPIDPSSDLLVIATDAPLPPFSDFDPFGNVIGFNNAVIERIASRAGLDYEFVVTPSDGVLDNIAAGSARDFDAVMSALVIPETPPPDIAFTDPYLEVGQVLVVLVDERDINGAADIQPGTTVGGRWLGSCKAISFSARRPSTTTLEPSFSPLPE